ncbi:MAG TPA: SAM-dependent methyltransferase [Casimicrobiaceae bacterium]|jgi:SAM-dependent MidA family methyltransferase|nr:SAM-dependent methyltransferase [Casimicrobiaceae bacterium]
MIDPRVPVPDDEARAHSARVAAHVRDEIGRAGGFITFARYMDLVLYAPGLGYYVAGARKFGDAGDFVTAPELTPLFGAALARQIEVVLATTSAREIVELGAGSGALAASMLNALAEAKALPSRYAILEPSPELRARQQATLEALSARSGARIEWIERLPDTIGGIVVMNEVLDAIAPNIVARRDGQWYERGVALADATFAWAERPLDDAKLLALARARFPDDGDYLSEVNPAAEALVATIAKRVGEGGILIVDYGFPAREYYHAQRASGTLVGHYRHRVHDDPFLWPGLSDLTSHVDFTAIARAGQRAGLRVAGFATQASFLLGCGLLERLRAAGTPGSVDYVRASAAVQKLLSPAEMGELFKMLLLARRDVPFLALHDVAHRL